MDIIKVLENMPDGTAEMHRYIGNQLSGMFSDCVLPLHEPWIPDMKYVGDDGLYKKCTVIEYPYLLAKFIASGIEDKKISFGHDTIDSFFLACYYDDQNLAIKRPELYQKAKKYLNSACAINIKGTTYSMYGDFKSYMNDNFYSKIQRLLTDDADKTIIVFDVDTIIMKSRAPMLEAAIQVAISIPQTVCQAIVEIDRNKYKNKQYKIL